MTNTRQPGYYRVKYKDEWTVGKWISADGFDQWAIPESEYYYYDEELDEIDPTPINPEPQPLNTAKLTAKDYAAAEKYLAHKSEGLYRDICTLGWDAVVRLAKTMAEYAHSKISDQEAGKV